MYKIYRFNLDKKSFGRTLSRLMKENEYTIGKFSSKTGYDVNTVKKWRSGERIPKMETLHTLAKLLGVSMHELLMPESLYATPFSDELLALFNNRLAISSLSLSAVEEIKQYSEYLFQKMLFSFLSFKELTRLKVLFSCFSLTPYGKDKLNMSDDSFEGFYSSAKDYIKREYGSSLPYYIDRTKSEQVYRDFQKMISLNSIGGDQT